MELQEKERGIDGIGGTKLGVYCHIPFCASTCDFCAFYQEKPRRGDLDRYLSAMEFEFVQLPEDRIVDTVFWGGGTPGLLSAKDLERLGSALLQNLKQAPKEWTIEMAPSTVKVDKLKVLRDLGVTRVSMGVQSFDNRLLQSLGRLHAPNQIYTAWERIEEAGFPETNLDLIFAIPNQSLKQWEFDIREAARLGSTHLSTYCLTFEEDTALYVKLSEGKVHIDEDRELEFYERGWELLAELGYEQYEVSNFSKKDSECIHNVNTWKMQEWIGCGPSAASQYLGRRYQRPSSLDAWTASIEEGRLPEKGVSELDASILYIDALVFGLRMNQGVDLEQIAARFPSTVTEGAVKDLLRRLEVEGLLRRFGALVKLTHAGRLVSDAVGSALLELTD